MSERRRRRLRRYIVKQGLYQKAAWLVSAGMPHTYIVEKLGIAPNTLRHWRRFMPTDGVVQRLVRQAKALSAPKRQELLEALQRAA